MRETDEGLYVEGTLDIHDSDLARQAWRSVKKNRIGLSFGYLITDERVGGDGVKELLGLDVFEITLTATPANPDARVLSAKSAGEQDLRTAAREHMLAVLTGPQPAPTLDELRAKTKALGVEELARKAKPIQIATFEG